MPTTYRTIDPTFVVAINDGRIIAAGDVDQPRDDLPLVHLEMTTATPYLAEIVRPREQTVAHVDRDGLIIIAFAMDGDGARAATLFASCPRRMKRVLRDAIRFVAGMDDTTLFLWARITGKASDAGATRH